MLQGGCDSQPEPELYDVHIGKASWRVEVAVTEAQQRRGLAERDELPAGRGMLFVYDSPHVMKFWMKGCRIPLDIAFIDARHRVVNIHTMPCEPPDIRFNTYSSDVPSLLALEVPANALHQAGVRVGDVVTFDPRIPLPAPTKP